MIKSLEPCKRYNIKVLKIFQIILVQFQILLFLSWGGFFNDTMESQALQPWVAPTNRHFARMGAKPQARGSRLSYIRKSPEPKIQNYLAMLRFQAFN